MNVTQESNGNLTAIIHVNLTEEDYTPGVTQQLTDYRKKANMPGFRVGKVPMGIIKKMYGKGVIAEEVNKKVSEALNNYIVENKLNVLGYPLPNMEKTTTIDFDKQSDFDFYFDIGLAPEFDVELSEEIKVPHYTIKVNDDEVENAINDIKVRTGEEENPEKAEETDGFQGKFSEVDAEENVVEGGHEHAAFFKIEDIKLKTIQKKLIGLGAGDKVVFNLMKAFKDEAKVKSLLHIHDGSEDKLDLDYQFEVEKVVRMNEAELNEELYKKVFPTEEIKTEEEFRNKISKELSQRNSSESDRQFLNDAVEELIKLSNIEIPDEFMKRWLVESNEGKITAEQVDTQYDSYVRTIKWQLIDAKLHELYGEELKVDQEEVRDKVRAYFSQGAPIGEEKNPQIEQIVDQVLQNQEESQKLHNGILDEKYIKLLKEKVKLSEKEVDSEKFNEIVSNIK